MEDIINFEVYHYNCAKEANKAKKQRRTVDANDDGAISPWLQELSGTANRDSVAIEKL